MRKFELHSDFAPTGDQPEAIRQLTEGVLSGAPAQTLLGDRARQIIKLRFFEGKTQIEVAEEINISQAQVSRLEKNALKNMHGYLEA